MNAKLGTRIDLLHFARNTWNVEYNPRKHNAAILRFRHPKSTAIVFESGSVNILGASSRKNACKTLKKLRIKLRNAGLVTCIKNVRITNVVGKYCFGSEICYEKFKNIPYTVYEPDMFHAPKFKTNSCTLVCFNTGTILACGKSIAHHKNAILKFKKLYECA